MKYIFPLNKLPYDKQRLSGGKASSLAGIIQNTHIRVPEGYVLLSDAFEGFELKNRKIFGIKRGWRKCFFCRSVRDQNQCYKGRYYRSSQRSYMFS